MPLDLSALAVPPRLPVAARLRDGSVFLPVGAAGGILWIAPHYPGII